MTEDQLEQETLVWLGEVGYSHLHGPAIAPDGESPERANYQQVLLPFRLRKAIHRLNPDISAPCSAVLQGFSGEATANVSEVLHDELAPQKGLGKKQRRSYLHNAKCPPNDQRRRLGSFR